jgi:transposase-like protein
MDCTDMIDEKHSFPLYDICDTIVPVNSPGLPGFEQNMIVEANKSKNRAGVKCKFCHSCEVVKNGLRNNTQYWLCKSCGHAFVNNQALPKMKYPVEIVAKSVDDFYNGTSLHKICNGLEQTRGALPSISAVYEWVRKLTQNGLSEAKKHFPQVSDIWVVSIVSIWLNHKVYLYINILDVETQFLIASKLGKFEDIKSVFEIAKEKADKCPRLIITNGWRGYSDVIEQVFGADTSHSIVSLRQCKEVSSNYLSYLKYWRDVFKTKYKQMHHMDENIQLIVDGMVLRYNFFSPHGNPGQKTPAEAAQIAFPYRNWLDIAKS